MSPGNRPNLNGNLSPNRKKIPMMIRTTPQMISNLPRGTIKERIKDEE
jgi:hypothetical protein